MSALRRRARHGAAAIEFALILPVYVAMIFAITDWCWYVYCKTTVQDIAVRAARAGALSDPLLSPSPEAIAAAEALDLLQESGFDTSATAVEVQTLPDRIGTTIDLVIDQPFHAPSQFISAMMSLSLTGHGSVHAEFGA